MMKDESIAGDMCDRLLIAMHITIVGILDRPDATRRFFPVRCLNDTPTAPFGAFLRYWSGILSEVC